jgi:hypothetical protein
MAMMCNRLLQTGMSVTPHKRPRMPKDRKSDSLIFAEIEAVNTVLDKSKRIYWKYVHYNDIVSFM